MAGIGSSAKILLIFCIIAGGVGTARARFLNSKDAGVLPRARMGCYPSSTVGTRYPDPSHLGLHSYRFSPRERGGMVYTCRAGHIDVSHLRKASDWTAYLASHIRQVLLSNKTEYTYRMREPSKHYLHFQYPRDWVSLPLETRERIASDMAIELAEYCTYTGMVWHEILTWFGFKAIGVYPEYMSAFSWEDVYSNLVGCRLAAEALRDPNQGFEEAMTALIDRELQRLGVQPRPAARRAGQAVRGQWFVGDFLFCDIVKRNFDIGLDDGFVTPWAVPGVGGCTDEAPMIRPVPDLSVLSKYRFSMKYEIEPREWERQEILRIVYPSREEGSRRIDPARHFRTIMDYIHAQAVRRYGLYVDDRSLPSRLTPPSPVTKPAEAGGVAAESPILTGARLGMQPAGVRQATPSNLNIAHSEPAPGGMSGGHSISTAEVLTFAYFWLGEEP